MRLTSTTWTDLDSGNRIEATRTTSNGACRFAVRNDMGQCLNKDGEWEYEHQPSSRDAAFYERCRFDKFFDAANMLEQAT